MEWKFEWLSPRAGEEEGKDRVRRWLAAAELGRERKGELGMQFA